MIWWNGITQYEFLALQIDWAFITYVWILGARKPAFSQKVEAWESISIRKTRRKRPWFSFARLGSIATNWSVTQNKSTEMLRWISLSVAASHCQCLHMQHALSERPLHDFTKCHMKLGRSRRRTSNQRWKRCHVSNTRHLQPPADTCHLLKPPDADSCPVFLSLCVPGFRIQNFAPQPLFLLCSWNHGRFINSCTFRVCDLRQKQLIAVWILHLVSMFSYSPDRWRSATQSATMTFTQGSFDIIICDNLCCGRCRSPEALPMHSGL